jgi:hypothetical protein
MELKIRIRDYHKMNQRKKDTKRAHTSIGSSTTGWQSKPDPTSRTIAVNSLPPLRNISIRTLSSIPYKRLQRAKIL